MSPIRLLLTLLLTVATISEATPFFHNLRRSETEYLPPPPHNGKTEIEYLPPPAENEVKFFDIPDEADDLEETSDVKPAAPETEKSFQEFILGGKELKQDKKVEEASFPGREGEKTQNKKRQDSALTTPGILQVHEAVSSQKTSEPLPTSPEADNGTSTRVAFHPTHHLTPPEDLDACNTTACPSGWTRHRCSCYILSSSRTSWTAAHHTCASLHPHSRLATIHDEETSHLLGFLASEAGRRNTWIGLTRLEHGWGWSDGADVEYEDWDKGQPNGQKKGQDCVHLGGDSKRWHDNWCNRKMNALCQLKLH